MSNVRVRLHNVLGDVRRTTEHYIWQRAGKQNGDRVADAAAWCREARRLDAELRATLVSIGKVVPNEERVALVTACVYGRLAIAVAGTGGNWREMLQSAEDTLTESSGTETVAPDEGR